MNEKVDVEITGVSASTAESFIQGLLATYEKGRTVSPAGEAGGVILGVTPAIMARMVEAVMKAFNDSTVSVVKSALGEGVKIGYERGRADCAKANSQPSPMLPVAPGHRPSGSTAMVLRDKDGKISTVVQKFIYDDLPPSS